MIRSLLNCEYYLIIFVRDEFHSVKVQTELIMKNTIPDKTVERLILYKRLLTELEQSGKTNIYSHQIAVMADVTPALVRRDLLAIEYKGVSKTGYLIADLIKSISGLTEEGTSKSLILAGLGNLGRALLTYFNAQQNKFNMVAAFDNDPAKIGRVIAGCHCYAVRDMARYIRELQVELAILTVSAEAAQYVAEQMVESGIKGILNFTPIRLRLNKITVCDELDISLKLEKLAFLSKTND